MQKLELTWIGKDEEIRVEPRILLNKKDLDYGDTTTGNMLIHGDNLLALKALEQDFTGRVKCIYIDPPYNTGAAFEHYDDNLEHSTWLNLMYHRLKILRNLLADEGSIFIQIDNNEMAHLKVLCDEIFYKRNFVQMMSVKRASPAGFKVINPGPITVTEYILFYAKNKEKMFYTPQRIPVNYDQNYDSYIENPDDNPSEWKILKLTSLLYERWNVTDWRDLKNKFGKNWKIIRDAALGELALELNEQVVSVRDPHKPSETIKRVMSESKAKRGKVFVIERENYNPIYIYNGGSLSFYRDKLRIIDNVLTPTELLTDFWGDINYAGIAKEGGVQFKNSKKPEMLIKRILDLSTNPGDLVLDSFLGSGTTAAVAHKMNRRYIGIEMGEHAYTHAKVRLDRVINGEDSGGVSVACNWTGGGGYKFYELAPTLIVKDKHGNQIFSDKYNAACLAAAVAKINGFRYAPDDKTYWKQGKSDDNCYIFVTTEYLTAKKLDEIAEEVSDFEHLLICAPAFDLGLNKRYGNIEIRKIPMTVLEKCEYGVANYNLNIINPPTFDEEEFEDA